MPARSNSTWLGATASAGVSFNVGIRAFDQRTEITSCERQFPLSGPKGSETARRLDRQRIQSNTSGSSGRVSFTRNKALDHWTDLTKMGSFSVSIRVDHLAVDLIKNRLLVGRHFLASGFVSYLSMSDICSSYTLRGHK